MKEKKYVLFIIFGLFITDVFAGNSDELINRFGLSFSFGFSNAVHSGQGDFKTDTYSYEPLLLYNLKLNEKFEVIPLIGFTKAVLNVSDHFYARRTYNFLSAGSLFCYNINKFQPNLGIRAQKVISIIYFDELDNHDSDVTEYYSSVLFQIEAGFNYRINRCRIGINAWIGLNNLTSNIGYSPYRMNQYYLTFTYYPFK